MTKMLHIPVLLSETLALLSVENGDRILDVTLGLGGHSFAMMQVAEETGTLTALDADAENIASARDTLKAFGDHVTIVHANFNELPGCLPVGRREFDVVLADLGLSSPHIDEPSRGFTFRVDTPLDMRFDRSKGMTAAMLLASLDSSRLKEIFREWGEIPGSGRFVDAIVERRRDNPVRTTGELKSVAESVFGYKAATFLPQIFQALRIAVNRELDSLKILLDAVPLLLAPGGRFAVISYHSLEDALVKAVFRSLTTNIKDPMTGAAVTKCAFIPLTKKAVSPGDFEIGKNPRSRSARLRAIARRSVYTPDRSTC